MLENTVNKKIWNEFIDFLKYDKKMKENTMLSYQRDISAFLEFAKKEGAELFCDTVSFFDEYMDNLRKEKSSSTVSRNIASLRSFFRFLRDRGYSELNPTRGVKYEKKIKSDDNDDEILTTDEIDRLIGATAGDGFKALRDRAIIETLYACGLKASELINLKTENLFLKEGYIKIEAEPPRYVPIYKGAAKAVREYIAKGRCEVASDKKNTFLFLNRSGKPVTRQGLWKILKSYSEKAKIDKEITPHLIRRSMAVHLMENGAQIFDIKDILGHKSVNLTKAYVKDFKPSVISAYEKSHPKAKEQ